ncbi:hypothetical protein Bhyg_01628 [Pseudolycoriella hygida]|uniref:Fuseless n=1 Tax=Pseudolycoriella hygida TaxID=35572 RepID=A0A9Q0S5R4_9DIPT|nr:hypothetical protein Bhyg_01628 [Pseudolycoriella hygida]
MRGSTAGLADGVIAPPESVHATFLHFIDIAFSTMIVAPSVILYWRGTWNLTGLFLFPRNPQIGAIISLSVGFLGHLVFNIFQEKIKKNLHPDKHRITYLMCSRIYTYVYGFACVNCWRGVWILMEHHVPFILSTVFTITFVAAISLVFMKGMRNICATPFSIASDHSMQYFNVPTYFKTSAQDPGLYILDCAFSVLVIGTLVVFVWRGTWVMCDLIIYPDDLRMTAWGSLVIGYGIVALTFAMQSLMRWACDRLKGFWRVAAADIFLFLSFIGTVNVWRGVWQLCDLYFLKGSPVLSNAMTHSCAFLLLALLNCSNSVIVRGVYIDAEEPAGQCVIFPVYYIRLFFQKERTKKQQRLIDALEKLDHNKTTEALLPDKTGKTPIILPMNNTTNIHQRSIELQAMLSDVENVNEKSQNGEHMILRSAKD